MTLGSDSDGAEGCASSPSFYNVSLAILFLFFFCLLLLRVLHRSVGALSPSPLCIFFYYYYFCVVVVETTVMVSAEAASSGS